MTNTPSPITTFHRPMQIRIRPGHYELRMLRLLQKLLQPTEPDQPQAPVSRKALLDRASNGSRTELVYQKSADSQHSTPLEELFDHLKLTGLVDHHRNGNATITELGAKVLASTEQHSQVTVLLTDADVVSLRAAGRAYQRKYDMTLFEMRNANYRARLFDSNAAMERQLKRLEALGLGRHSTNGYFHLSEAAEALLLNLDEPAGAASTASNLAAVNQSLTASIQELLVGFRDLLAGYPSSELSDTPKTIQARAITALAAALGRTEESVRGELEMAEAA